MEGIFAVAEISLLVGLGPYLVPAFSCEHSTLVFLCAAEVLCSVLECGKS